MKQLTAILKRDLLLGWRQGGGALTGALFFLCLILLVSLGVGPDKNLLARIAPAVLWIGALLAILLSLDRLFQADADDGTLDILLICGVKPELMATSKICAHWLNHGVPLILLSPLYGLMLGLDGDALLRAMLCLGVGTPALTFIGALGAALTLNMRRGGLLLPVLVLPLTLPLLIFGTLAIVPGPQSLSALMALCGLCLLIVLCFPFAIAAAIKSSRG